MTGARRALILARGKFLAGERIDMSALAREVGVNRVTLYRWLGPREQVLADVIWSVADGALRRGRSRTRKRGAERIVRVVLGLVEDALSHPAVARYVSEEGEQAIRLLTRRDTGVHPRLTEAIEELLAEEVQRGTIELRANLYELADTVMRIVESYVYVDRVSGQELDPGRAEAMIRLLLR